MAAAVTQFSLVAHARAFDFSAGKWNRGDPIVQMPDCIMNANNPEWSDD